jgi:GxxExxY protein
VAGTDRKLLYADEVFAIQGAIYEVSNAMGAGFLEAVYQECLVLEFEARGIPFAAHPQLRLAYKGSILAQKYVPDFVCYGAILIELKAVRDIVSEHKAQILNYLRASDLRLGLLVNFATTRVQIQRFAL